MSKVLRFLINNRLSVAYWFVHVTNGIMTDEGGSIGHFIDYNEYSKETTLETNHTNLAGILIRETKTLMSITNRPHTLPADWTHIDLRGRKL